MSKQQSIPGLKPRVSVLPISRLRAIPAIPAITRDLRCSGIGRSALETTPRESGHRLNLLASNPAREWSAGCLNSGSSSTSGHGTIGGRACAVLGEPGELPAAKINHAGQEVLRDRSSQRPRSEVHLRAQVVFCDSGDSGMAGEMKHSTVSTQHTAGNARQSIPHDYGDSARFRRSQFARFFLAAFFALTVIYFAAHVLAAWLRGSLGALP